MWARMRTRFKRETRSVSTNEIRRIE